MILGSSGRVRQLRWQNSLPPLLVCFFYLSFPNIYPGFISNNELSRLFLTRAIVDRGTFAIDDEPLIKNRNARFGDVAYYGGHFYSDKAIGTSLFAVPIYALLKLFYGDSPVPDATAILLSRLLVVTAGALLFLVLFYRRCKTFGALGPPLFLGLALGSSFFPQALSFTGHVPMAVLLLWVFLRLLNQPTSLPVAGRPQSLRPQLAELQQHGINGLLCGLAVLFDFTAGFFTGLVVLLMVLRQVPLRALGGFALGMLPAVAVMLYYNACCFAHPFDIAYNHMYWPEAVSHRGSAFFGIGLPRGDALWGLTFGGQRGLFTHAPFLLLLFPALWRITAAKKWTPAIGFATFVVVGYFYLNVALVDWQGGWSLGPRYLVPIYGFCLWLIGRGYRYEKKSTRFAYLLVATAGVTWSVCLHGLAISTWSAPPLLPDFSYPALQASWYLLLQGSLAVTTAALMGLGAVSTFLINAVLLVFALLLVLRHSVIKQAPVVGLTLLAFAVMGYWSGKNIAVPDGSALTLLLGYMGF